MLKERALIINGRRQPGVTKEDLDAVKKKTQDALGKIARQKGINKAFGVPDIVLKNPKASNRCRAYMKKQQ